jgi:hypothetical protein
MLRIGAWIIPGLGLPAAISGWTRQTKNAAPMSDEQAILMEKKKLIIGCRLIGGYLMIMPS